MKVLTRQQILKNEEFYIKEIKKGKIFIYPTDTIYGIGCIATNSKAIKKIRQIKERDKSPFSIIAPSKAWILDNCEVSDIKYLDKLPGPYTLILKLKNKTAISKETNPRFKTLGVRIPKNWFSKLLERANLTFITTSVNISGQKHLTNIKDLKKEIAEEVDYIIDSSTIKGKPSTIKGKPSTIIDLTGNKVKQLRR